MLTRPNGSLSTLFLTDEFYGYTPSKAAAGVIGAVFAVLFVGHAWSLARYRSWFMSYFVVGVAAESVGYFLRIWSATKPTVMGPYIATTLFIILAPAFLAASIYTSFGRIAAFVGQQHSPVRASRVTAIFVSIDVLSFLLQGGGGGLQTNGTSQNLGKTILVVGLVVQIVGLGIFTVFAAIFHYRARRAGEPNGPWVTCLWTLYAGCVLILIRSVYRTVEYATSSSNSDGYLVSHEGICTSLLHSFSASDTPGDDSTLRFVADCWSACCTQITHWRRSRSCCARSSSSAPTRAGFSPRTAVLGSVRTRSWSPRLADRTRSLRKAASDRPWTARLGL